MFGFAYKRTPWTDWNPFGYTGNVRTVPLRKTSAFKGIDEIDAHILSACQKMGYQIVQTKKDTGSFLCRLRDEGFPQYHKQKSDSGYKEISSPRWNNHG